MARVDSVSGRYQSYNIEMLEVTGGKFWKPDGPELDSIPENPPPAAPATSGGDTPAEDVSFAPAMITFLSIPEAGNSACR